MRHFILCLAALGIPSCVQEDTLAVIETAFESNREGDDDLIISENGSSIAIACGSEECAQVLSPTYTNFVDPTVPDPAQEVVNRQNASTDAYTENSVRVLQEAEHLIAEGRGLEEITFTLVLPEHPFDFTRFRTARGEARIALIDERKSQLAAAQHHLGEVVTELGGRVEANRWIANLVYIAIPAASAAELVNNDLVVAALPETEGSVEDLGDGVERMYAINPQGFPYIGETGTSGGNLGGPILAAVVEAAANADGSANNLSVPHLGWNDSLGFTRIWLNRVCNASTCSLGASGSIPTHGQWVGSVLMGSLREGQDGAITNPSDRRRRSGLATHAKMAYLRVSSNSSSRFVRAIEEAVELDVDVINMSWQLPVSECADLCSRTLNPSGIFDALYQANAAGVMLVKSAGNEQDETDACPAGVGTSFLGSGYPAFYQDCNVTNPGTHPDVIAVSALTDTDDFLSGTPDGFDEVGIAQYSSRGYSRIPDMSGLNRIARLEIQAVDG